MTDSTQMRPIMLKERDAANYLNVKVGTLRKWRSLCVGPPYLKVGGAVRYHPADIETFIEASRREAAL